MIQIAYFSSTSENTHRFVTKLGLTAKRIPLKTSDPALTMREPYALFVPTYGGGNVKGAVPKQVIRFLNNPTNRASLVAVISAGNTNFGSAYGIAGEIISTKCKVPHLYQFELMGTPDDTAAVRERLTLLWKQLTPKISTIS